MCPILRFKFPDSVSAYSHEQLQPRLREVRVWVREALNVLYFSFLQSLESLVQKSLLLQGPTLLFSQRKDNT